MEIIQKFNDSSPMIWTLLGVIVGALSTGIINYLLQLAQFKHNKDMFFLQNKGRETVKDILVEKLNHRIHIERSFDALKKNIGGYTDDEIRQMLHDINAKKSANTKPPGEWWYLRDREQEHIERMTTNNSQS